MHFKYVGWEVVKLINMFEDSDMWELLWIWLWTVEFFKMWVISRLTGEMLASQERR